jgi:hypothetical protein
MFSFALMRRDRDPVQKLKNYCTGNSAWTFGLKVAKATFHFGHPNNKELFTVLHFLIYLFGQPILKVAFATFNPNRPHTIACAIVFPLLHWISIR